MHVLIVSTVSDHGRFWSGLKKAHSRLPGGARWTLAVASTDGAKAVNVIAHESVDAVRRLVEEHAGAYATTEYSEADAANAVGLTK